jgi:fermentation-respiration switch protein FrsA (DUF1100 family)
MVDELEERLPRVQCPVTIMQGTDDPVVEPKSAELIHARLGTGQKKLFMVPSTKHGILYEDIGDTQERIVSFLAALSFSERPARATTAAGAWVMDRLIRGSVAWIRGITAAKHHG